MTCWYCRMSTSKKAAINATEVRSKFGDAQAQLGWLCILFRHGVSLKIMTWKMELTESQSQGKHDWARSPQESPRAVLEDLHAIINGSCTN